MYQKTIQILISDSSGYFSSPELLVSMFWPFLDKKWLYWQLQCVVFFVFFRILCFFCRIGLLVLDDTLRSCLWPPRCSIRDAQRLWSRASQWWKWGNYKHAFSCSPTKNYLLLQRPRVWSLPPISNHNSEFPISNVLHSDEQLAAWLSNCSHS